MDTTVFAANEIGDLGTVLKYWGTITLIALIKTAQNVNKGLNS